MLHIIIKILLCLTLPCYVLNLYLALDANASVDFVKIDEKQRNSRAIAAQVNSVTKANLNLNQDVYTDVDTDTEKNTDTATDTATDKNTDTDKNTKLIEQIQIKAQSHQQQTLKLSKTIIKNIEDNVSKHVNEAAQIAQDAQAAQAAQATQDANADLMIDSNSIIPTNIKETNIPESMLNEYKKFHQVTKSQNSCSARIKDGLKIFISFSMPREIIQNYDYIARKIGAKLIIRGLINNSFKETISYIKQLNEQGMMIDIDPRPFNDFKINLVPSFVISSGNNYDKLVGNVSVIYALEQFAASGDAAVLAKEYLERLTKARGDLLSK